MASGAGDARTNGAIAAQERAMHVSNMSDPQNMDTVSELGEEEEIYGACSTHPESETPSESGREGLTWISWFCSLAGHQYFAEVAEDFIEDDFNLTGLNFLVPFYKEALEMILDIEPQEDSLKIPDVSIVESSAELLYGLIHQRYILTRQGMQQMVGGPRLTHRSTSTKRAISACAHACSATPSSCFHAGDRISRALIR